MKLPKISVVTPSYNQGQFIEETILSVIGQGYPNLEYIIIDGGSTDATVEIIKKYEKHLSYWVTEKDNGQSHALNKGFTKATGDIFCWLNSDDLFLPSTLSYISTLFQDCNSHSIIFGNCIHFNELHESVSTYGSNVVKAAKIHTLENYDYIIQPSTFWTKETWGKVGSLRENLCYAFDWEWFLRAKRLSVSFTSVAKCFSLYRIHKDHKTSTGGNKRQEEILTIYKEYSDHYSTLYSLLIKEDLNFSNFRNKIIGKARKLLKKPVSKGRILKITKSDKYKNYTDEEIDKCLTML